MVFKQYLFLCSFLRTQFLTGHQCTFKYLAEGNICVLYFYCFTKFDAFRDDLIVQFLLPNTLLQLIAHDGIRNGQLISVVPVLFSQGVHDIQVLSK